MAYVISYIKCSSNKTKLFIIYTRILVPAVIVRYVPIRITCPVAQILSFMDSFFSYLVSKIKLRDILIFV